MPASQVDSKKTKGKKQKNSKTKSQNPNRTPACLLEIKINVGSFLQSWLQKFLATRLKESTFGYYERFGKFMTYPFVT